MANTKNGIRVRNKWNTKVSSTKKGDREGKWNFYSEKGTLLSFTFYAAGKKNGYSVVKYPNGKIHYYGAYKDDQMVGEWITYDQQGQKTIKIFNP